MTTIDNLLIKLNQHGFDNFDSHIPKKDIKILKSLSTSVCLPSFITENQSRLLVKILGENSLHFLPIEPEIKNILLENSWSKSFRKLDQIRKLYLTYDEQQNPRITVEFTHSPSIRKTLSSINKNILGDLMSVNGKLYHVTLTEQNLISVLDALKYHKFEIDEKLKNYQKIIKNWEISEVKKDFTFEENLSDKIKQALVSECGPVEDIPEAIVQDRSFKYQYFTKKTSKNPENLVEKLIFRNQQKVWINSNNTSLAEVFQALMSIDRLPALVVFDTWNNEECLKKLEYFHENLQSSGIFDNVGIYFRLENNELGKKFNSLVSEKKYNSKLTADTKFAVIQATKLPKFFLKDCDWSPKSVIVVGSSLRHSKASVYANRCDLIISYTEKEALMERISNSWQK